jgi:nitroimidazol reductase NimA-like FMN-containing flavoprotein (pyridoxamine 5'-phosphate oxidase superfamily)
MTDDLDPAAIARAIIEDNLYMVLGTADRDGRPWVTPVYYAPASPREFLWVSRPDATHSRNLDVRRDVSIVIFDSSVPIGTGQGVYMSGTAEELSGEACAEAVEIFSRRSLGHHGREWTTVDVQGPAPHRLYRATAAEQFVLDEHDERVPVTRASSA